MKKLVTLAVAASLCWAVTGCGSDSDTAASPKTDSGIAWCQKLAATAAQPESQSDGAAPSDEEFDQAEDAWNGSSFSDLKRAGLAHLKAVKAYYEDSDAEQLGDVVVKRKSLNATCAKHGVVIPEPSFVPPSMEPLPTNPYGK